jgi:hypothetical protein
MLNSSEDNKQDRYDAMHSTAEIRVNTQKELDRKVAREEKLASETA